MLCCQNNSSSRQEPHRVCSRLHAEPRLCRVPICIQGIIVKYESLAETSAYTVAKPRLTLVALRTVNGHALIVAQYAPHGVMINLVEYGVGTFKRACHFHLVAYHFAHNAVCSYVVKTSNLGITEAVIYKSWRPPTAVLVAGSNIIVGCKRVAQVLCEQTTISLSFSAY